MRHSLPLLFFKYFIHYKPKFFFQQDVTLLQTAQGYAAVAVLSASVFGNFFNKSKKMILHTKKGELTRHGIYESNVKLRILSKIANLHQISFKFKC